MMEKTVTLNINVPVAEIILNKGPLNIFSIAEINLLTEYLRELNDLNNIKCVVIRSALKDFSAGMDVKEHTVEKIESLLSSINHLIESLLHCKYPVITLLTGNCLGGGFEIALWSDIILVSKNLKAGLPEINLAHMPPYALTVLPEMISSKVATELILTGNTITADQALSYNLVNAVFAEESFTEESGKYIKTLTDKSQAALMASIKVLRSKNIRLFKEYQSQINSIYLQDLISHPDSAEGITAFVEKRGAVWQI